MLQEEKNQNDFIKKKNIRWLVPRSGKRFFLFYLNLRWKINRFLNISIHCFNDNKKRFVLKYLRIKKCYLSFNNVHKRIASCSQKKIQRSNYANAYYVYLLCKTVLLFQHFISCNTGALFIKKLINFQKI